MRYDCSSGSFGKVSIYTLTPYTLVGIFFQINWTCHLFPYFTLFSCFSPFSLFIIVFVPYNYLSGYKFLDAFLLVRSHESDRPSSLFLQNAYVHCLLNCDIFKLELLCLNIYRILTNYSTSLFWFDGSAPLDKNEI